MKTKRKLARRALARVALLQPPPDRYAFAVPKPNCSSLLELTKQRIGLFGAHKKRLA